MFFEKSEDYLPEEIDAVRLCLGEIKDNAKTKKSRSLANVSDETLADMINHYYEDTLSFEARPITKRIIWRFLTGERNESGDRVQSVPNKSTLDLFVSFLTDEKSEYKITDIDSLIISNSKSNNDFIIDPELLYRQYNQSNIRPFLSTSQLFDKYGYKSKQGYYTLSFSNTYSSHALAVSLEVFDADLINLKAEFKGYCVPTSEDNLFFILNRLGSLANFHLYSLDIDTDIYDGEKAKQIGFIMHDLPYQIDYYDDYLSCITNETIKNIAIFEKIC